MPNEWINSYRQTNEIEVLDSNGIKMHDYISCEQGAGVPVDKELHPELWSKLGGTDSCAYDVTDVSILTSSTSHQLKWLFTTATALYATSNGWLVEFVNNEWVDITYLQGEVGPLRSVVYIKGLDVIALLGNGKGGGRLTGLYDMTTDTYSNKVAHPYDLGHDTCLTSNADGSVLTLIGSINTTESNGIKQSLDFGVTWNTIRAISPRLGNQGSQEAVCSPDMQFWSAGAYPSGRHVSFDGGLTWSLQNVGSGLENIQYTTCDSNATQVYSISNATTAIVIITAAGQLTTYTTVKAVHGMFITDDSVWVYHYTSGQNIVYYECVHGALQGDLREQTVPANTVSYETKERYCITYIGGSFSGYRHTSSQPSYMLGALPPASPDVPDMTGVTGSPAPWKVIADPS